MKFLEKNFKLFSGKTSGKLIIINQGRILGNCLLAFL